jgi:flagellar motor switch protein FliN/FliY
MSELPDNTPARELADWIEAWRGCTQTVLAQIAQQTAAVEIAHDPFPQGDSDCWFTVIASGAVRGEMSIRVTASSAIRLAQMLMGSTEPSAEITAEHRKTVEELLRQIAGLAATTIGTQAGGEVQLHLTASPAPSWSSAFTACLRAREDSGNTILAEIQISAALSQALQAPAGSSAASSASAVIADSVSPAAYGRLLDVGLDVKLRFGTRRMPLRDVLALSAGVVVELDNKVQSPADLLLDGRVIARGEVVVVDGKYGLRVTEIPGPSSTA